MSSRLERMEAILRQHLKPQQFQLVDESHKHEGHAGAQPKGETHYRLTVVASAFEGMTTLQRHRKINNLLADEYSSGLHALSMKAKTPAEAAAAAAV